jgi:hypothetical protein
VLLREVVRDLRYKCQVEYSRVQRSLMGGHDDALKHIRSVLARDMGLIRPLQDSHAG